MRDASAEFERRGVDLGVVTFGNAEMTGRFCEARGVTFPCYADPERRAYDAFALARTPPWRRLLDPRQARRYLRVLRAGHRARPSGLSYRQMPGTFLIATDGEIRYAHRNRFPADNPAVAELLAAAERVSSRA